MRGKQSRGWIDLLLRPLAVNKSTSMTYGAARALSSPTLLTLTASKLELEHLHLFQKIGAGLIAGGVI